ncbi:hypothetical protein ACFXG4_20545 [Nocardia sp. NPDC059246]|uniref:hypothetical protein n=1 Tax=unclassified Nocardia TaxID=2637762 RepID=UPI0036C2F8BF
MTNRPAFTAIAILILIAGLVGVVFAMAGSHAHHRDAERKQVPPVDLRAAPTGLKSVAFQGILLPSANEGPHSQTGAAVGGFDQSPIGAALAAIQATVRISIATDMQWPIVVQQMVAPGPARDEWAVARAQLSITAAISGEAPRIIAYRVAKFANDASDIEIYTRQPDESVTCNTATVIWQAADWRLRLPDQPHPAPVSEVLVVPVEAVRIELK